jgi:minor extracellular serine protease Vpr
VAPGSLASVWGTYGLGTSASSGTSPLPTAVSGLSIQVGGEPAPILFASPSLANIQIPWEAPTGGMISISSSLNGQTGSAQSFKPVPFDPGIFSINGQGTGQGSILDSSYRLVDSTHPATVGDLVQIYCTGLGPVMNAPPTGFPASSTELSQTTNNVVVTIGGAAATVPFSGLAPGQIGLYQVNAIIPTASTKGNAVPASISIGGVTSNTVTISVH